MSQVATRRKLDFEEERVHVEARFLEQGSIFAGTKQGACEGFKIELILRGDHSPEEVQELVHLAHRMCFTEDALNRPVPIEVEHRFNGEVMSSDGNPGSG